LDEDLCLSDLSRLLDCQNTAIAWVKKVYFSLRRRSPRKWYPPHKRWSQCKVFNKVHSVEPREAVIHRTKSFLLADAQTFKHSPTYTHPTRAMTSTSQLSGFLLPHQDGSQRNNAISCRPRTRDGMSMFSVSLCER
jgi:hypothetical protein